MNYRVAGNSCLFGDSSWQKAHEGAGIAQWYRAGLRAGWSRVPWLDSRRRGLRIFLFIITYRTALGPTQPPIQWVPGALPCGRGVKLPTHLHLVPRSRMRGAIPPLPQYAFMVWCLVKHKDNFTFTFTFTFYNSSFTLAASNCPYCTLTTHIFVTTRHEEDPFTESDSSPLVALNNRTYSSCLFRQRFLNCIDYVG
jgi:hypothetical protein